MESPQNKWCPIFLEAPQYMFATGTAHITSVTAKKFDGEIQEIPIGPGRHGPYYRVRPENLGEGPNLAEEYRKLARHSRSGFILQSKTKSNDPCGFESFVKSHWREIELDEHAELWPEIAKFFPEGHQVSVRADYDKDSIWRWIGQERPRDFDHANGLYELSHMKDEIFYLYEIYLELPRQLPKEDFQPKLLHGRVAGGTSTQIKLNNPAVECVVEVQKIERFSKPKSQQA
ncbi:MAG: hypothetical protein HY618_08165 [Candidatus Tectomicrobia bacterium]|uniref:Uncharacterized protein n=1 Tax=Tectimicrobiota bacterium TaxID=2528274 RepID=A0A932ZVQ1_UNCTE|nr:hypothetical protein [Candidatus Tectomicrobia bacterium]